MDDEKALVREAIGAVSEDFFERRLRSLRVSIREREERIEARHAIHYVLRGAINTERGLKEQRLRLLTMNYAAERGTLLRQIEGLDREERMELVRCMDRIAQLSKEAREKEEEYESMAQLFRSAAVEERGARAPGR